MKKCERCESLKNKVAEYEIAISGIMSQTLEIDGQLRELQKQFQLRKRQGLLAHLREWWRA